MNKFNELSYISKCSSIGPIFHESSALTLSYELTESKTIFHTFLSSLFSLQSRLKHSKINFACSSPIFCLIELTFSTRSFLLTDKHFCRTLFCLSTSRFNTVNCRRNSSRSLKQDEIKNFRNKEFLSNLYSC